MKKYYYKGDYYMEKIPRELSPEIKERIKVAKERKRAAQRRIEEAQKRQKPGHLLNEIDEYEQNRKTEGKDTVDLEDSDAA